MGLEDFSEKRGEMPIQKQDTALFTVRGGRQELHLGTAALKMPDKNSKLFGMSKGSLAMEGENSSSRGTRFSLRQAFVVAGCGTLAFMAAEYSVGASLAVGVGTAALIKGIDLIAPKI